MARNIHRRITWKKDPVAAAETAKRPRPVIKVVPRGDDWVFVPGQLFRLAVALEVIPPDFRWQPSPVPYVVESLYSAPRPYLTGYLTKGSLAVFVGHTRVEEMDGTQVRSLLKATFFIGSGKYLATNLNHFEPVS